MSAVRSPSVPADYPSTKRCCNQAHYVFCGTRHAAHADRVHDIVERLKHLAQRSKNAERPSLLFFNFGEAAAGRSFSLMWCHSLRQQSTQQQMTLFRSRGNCHRGQEPSGQGSPHCPQLPV